MHTLSAEQLRYTVVLVLNLEMELITIGTKYVS